MGWRALLFFHCTVASYNSTYCVAGAAAVAVALRTSLSLSVYVYTEIHISKLPRLVSFTRTSAPSKW